MIKSSADDLSVFHLNEKKSLLSMLITFDKKRPNNTTTRIELSLLVLFNKYCLYGQYLKENESEETNKFSLTLFIII